MANQVRVNGGSYTYNIGAITQHIDEMGQMLQKHDDILAKIAKIVSERGPSDPHCYADLPECIELLLDKAGLPKRTANL